MLVIVGGLVVVGAVLAGFVLSGGAIGALIHPTEILTIGGASLGALIIMSPVKVLKDLMKGLLSTLKGSPFNRETYSELFKLMYIFMRMAKKDGLLVLESHISDPHESPVFAKFPLIGDNHHVTDFIADSLSPVIEGGTTPEQLKSMMDIELKVLEEEHHAPLNALSKTADALPGFGIVAAVLGIVITMASIDGPVDEIGEKVGAALVGTFLGILASYGFFAPLAARMETLGASELSFFRTVSSIVMSFAESTPPKVAIEKARRSVASDLRPSRSELDELFKEAEAA